jgi:hypothetical protein
LHPNSRSINKTAVARKSLSLLILCVCAHGGLRAAETNKVERAPKFLGADSCASSGCHGGGGSHQNQFLVWSLRDVHHERPVATLTTARSRQIAAALKIKDATSASECVSCHAPLREVPQDLRGPLFRVGEGVSCESCHGPAENWLLSHTRTDYTHADRVNAGMRDLKDLYVRANGCVSCHQTVALPLLGAGHPELIFELDGQSVAQPKHWREAAGASGAQAWLVGQAAALREICWQLEGEGKGNKTLIEKRDALIWLLGKVDPKWTGAKVADADILAREIADMKWSPEITQTTLRKLAGGAADFRNKDVAVSFQARRAERLVLGLDRLFDPKLFPEAQGRLDRLFALAQSIPDFEPLQFAGSLEEFGKAVGN